jgi:hypothetical protein
MILGIYMKVLLQTEPAVVSVDIAMRLRSFGWDEISRVNVVNVGR